MDNIRATVVDHYRDVARRILKYSPTRMAELAPGVVAVEDKSGECDALFDMDCWQFTDPELWEQLSCFENPLFRSVGLQVLPGIGRAPRRVSTIEDMLNFARSQLSPKEDLLWHDAPQFFSF